MRLICILSFLTAAAFGQTMVEYGSVAGAAGASGAGLGKQAGSLLGNMGSALSRASGTDGAKPKTIMAPVARAKSTPEPEAPKVDVIAGLVNVKTGIARAELLASLGKPSSSISMPEDDHMMESMRYNVDGKSVVVIKLTDGVVTEIEKP